MYDTLASSQRVLFVATFLWLHPFIGDAAEQTAGPKISDGVAWYDVEACVEGKGWAQTKRYFDRLPAKAEGVVSPDVWGFSRHSAGMVVRFQTNSPVIWVRYQLLSNKLSMPYMPVSAVSGLDLYAQDDHNRWRWLAMVEPTAQTTQVKMVEGIDPGERTYMLYLPLYNGVESLQIGVAAASRFKPQPPRKDKPIVVYGTSIVQGGCASRPGMAWTAILGRMLDRPMINLGFCGCGTMDPEVADLLAELDAAVYVIDCLPNLRAPEVAQRAEMLVHKLRQAKPEVPIVLVDDRTYGNATFLKTQRDRNLSSRAALRHAYANLQAEGVKSLLYVEGDALLGEDSEGTVDGVHPSDLGMLRQATAMKNALQALFDK